ncbi:hypothetical protein [Neorhizobium sp. S3-V5DH]|jgi:hypothetical protein|uniref:hypothetical protein n=1 Tax=Neorhizobium sp. S3-V5DH TaxID=2485166 RepID=UPI00104B5D1D|nr:hypothetical protein [Neorhizobium sp. S3-V5DH]TCV67261.1 hypothetical protein EDE09_114117 [Neorhizobium sp. S3-V5DH]
MIKTTSITLLLVSAALATPALAEGDYYEGVQRQSPAAATSPGRNSLGDHSKTFYFPRSGAGSFAWNTTRDDRKIGDSSDSSGDQGGLSR